LSSGGSGRRMTMSSYRVGAQAEREFKRRLEREGYVVIRSAGSKLVDLVAARDGEILVVSVKVNKGPSKLEVEKIKRIAQEFRAKAVVAVKIAGVGWKVETLAPE